MEKIAMFFGIPTSKLVGKNDHTELDDMMSEDTPKTVEARSLAKGIDRMPKAQREAILNMMMGLYPGLFEEGTEEDET